MDTGHKWDKERKRRRGKEGRKGGKEEREKRKRGNFYYINFARYATPDFSLARSPSSRAEKFVGGTRAPKRGLLKVQPCPEVTGKSKMLL